MLSATTKLRCPQTQNNAPSTLRTYLPSADRARAVRCYASAASIPAMPVLADPAPAISVTNKALVQLKKLRAEAAFGSSEENLILRVGVKQGGCSGLSYKMDFEQAGNVTEDDHILRYEGFKLVIDPKSLLYLFGMHMDYSDALIGGGFQFQNPNAADSCGCGKSFGV